MIRLAISDVFIAFGMMLGIAGSILQDMLKVRDRNGQPRIPFSRLQWLATLLPVRTQKDVRKMLADQIEYVAELRGGGNYGRARWHVVLTWYLFLQYVVTSPISRAIAALLGR